ncbi:MAG: transcriptional regulator, family [Frankiales bacterium]|nr:transcriptional regulator, family [Frankiales bacterium]
MSKQRVAKRVTNGPTIRALREALGIRHTDFARDVRVSTGYLANIEADRRQSPGPDVVRRIADRLGVGVDAITYPVFVDVPDVQVPA